MHNNSEIIIAGAGSGHDITPEVTEALRDSDVIFGSSRFMNVIPAGKKFIVLKNFNEAFSQIRSMSGKIVILVSGDPGIYSLLPLIKKNFVHENLKVLPGISSLQIISARACENWNDAAILSGHGRNLSAGDFLNTVERNRITILFCDTKISPGWACKHLERMNSLEAFIGENLGTPDENIHSGKPEALAHKQYSPLSIMLVRNSEVYSPENIRPRDKDFIREENIHITHEAVRSVILDSLRLNNASILWDIGAGTGSISITAAHENIHSSVHAIEYNPKAASLISRNARKFHVHNVIIHNQRALNVIHSLPEPTHIFIGGSEGELRGILEFVMSLKISVHIVISCVTLENFNTAYEFMSACNNFEALSISVSASKKVNARENSFTMMSAKNPVMILSADTK